MAPTLCSRPERGQQPDTAESTAQHSSARASHMAKTKPLRSGMRSSASDKKATPNKRKSTAGITKRAKKARKPAAKRTAAITRTQSAQKAAQESLTPSAPVDATNMATDNGQPAPVLKRSASVDGLVPPSSKRTRVNSPQVIITHDSSDSTSPFELDAVSTSLSSPFLAKDYSTVPAPQVHADAETTYKGLEVEDVTRTASTIFNDAPAVAADGSKPPLDASMGAVDVPITPEEALQQPSAPVMKQVTPAQSSPLVLSLSPRAAERAERIVATPPAPQSSIATLSTPDALFVQEMIEQLERVSKWKTKIWYREQARRLLEVLAPATQPKASEALFLSPDEALNQLHTKSFFPGPIFVDGAQPMRLSSIKDFLGEYYDNNAKASIQDPSVAISKDRFHVRETTIGQLKERFEQGRPKIPWNCLELACHVEDGLRPTFLNNEDCRLITKLKIPTAEDHTSRRGFGSGFKEVEKWALLAQAGSLTAPHQDSHGYSTYITVQEGIVGFGWLANPTSAQYAAWLASPSTFVDGPWRYKILHPGTTVYFPNATVHFIFRLPSAGDTLAFGGHILRCSRIVSWAQTLIDERAHRAVTNEDISVSAPAYLERVAKYVKQARRMGQEEKWGGREAIAEFLRLKEKFMDMK